MKRLLTICLLMTFTLLAFAADTPKLEVAKKLELLTHYKDISDVLIAKANLKSKFEADMKTLDTEEQKARRGMQALIDKYKVDGFVIDFNKMDYAPVKPAAVTPVPGK